MPNDPVQVKGAPAHTSVLGCVGGVLHPLNVVWVVIKALEAIDSDRVRRRAVSVGHYPILPLQRMACTGHDLVGSAPMRSLAMLSVIF